MKEFIDKLIERLEEELNEIWGNTSLHHLYSDGCSRGIECAIEIINELAEEYKGGWIPCSERLPEVEADVLLSLRSLDVYTGFRANTEGCFYVEGEGYVVFENVLAWKPLPAPYTEGE